MTKLRLNRKIVSLSGCEIGDVFTGDANGYFCIMYKRSEWCVIPKEFTDLLNTLSSYQEDVRDIIIEFNEYSDERLFGWPLVKNFRIEPLEKPSPTYKPLAKKVYAKLDMFGLF